MKTLFWTIVARIFGFDAKKRDARRAELVARAKNAPRSTRRRAWRAAWKRKGGR